MKTLLQQLPQLREVTVWIRCADSCHLWDKARSDAHRRDITRATGKETRRGKEKKLHCLVFTQHYAEVQLLIVLDGARFPGSVGER